jgi:hypothetical protein
MKKITLPDFGPDFDPDEYGYAARLARARPPETFAERAQAVAAAPALRRIRPLAAPPPVLPDAEAEGRRIAQLLGFQPGPIARYFRAAEQAALLEAGRHNHNAAAPATGGAA